MLLGVGAAACAVALIATSGWLISRSAQRPAESALALAIVGVQFFALGRGLLRYCERLAGHDAALRVLASLRVRVYERLERLAPAGLPAFRSGDLLTRIVDDVDSIQDLLLRIGPPFAVAVLVGAATASLVASRRCPRRARSLLALLVLSATAVPWLAGRLAARSAARRPTPAASSRRRSWTCSRGPRSCSSPARWTRRCARVALSTGASTRWRAPKPAPPVSARASSAASAGWRCGARWRWASRQSPTGG